MFYVLIPIAIILVVFLLIMASYNQLVRLKSMAHEAWSGIEVQLKRRYDLIPNLVDIVKGYAQHEKNTFKEVVQMRTAAMQATTVEDKQAAEIGLTGALKTVFALAEQYPDLKANQNFLELQKELSSIEHELQLSRRYYNGAVRNYIISIHQFPSNILAKFFGFKEMDYFELNSDQERSVPKIKF